MFSEKEEILLHNYFDNLLSKDEQTEFEDCLLDNIDLAMELGKLKNLQRNLNNLPSNFNPPDVVIENIINSLLNQNLANKNIDSKQSKQNAKLIQEKKKIKRKLRPKTKYRLKQAALISVIVFFIVALVLGYFLIVKNSKTTPWKINNTNLEATQTNNNTSTEKLEENSIFETKEGDNFLILIENSGTINLYGRSKIKVLVGTKSLNSISYYFGNLNFNPDLNNKLFEVNYNQIQMQSINSNFLISSNAENPLVKILSNFIFLKSGGVEFKIPSNHSFYFVADNSISIPTNNNSSEEFIKLISSYSLTKNDVLLSKIIKSATKQESFTLFFMLNQVTPEYRELIIEKLKQIVPLPSSIAKESILFLEQSSLNIWWEQIYISTI